MKVNLCNLEKKFNNKLILNIPKFEIKENKVISILGQNGCGKTTLLKIITGLDKSYIGTILYNGEKINKEKSKNITMVMQGNTLLNRTVYENIAYPLRLRLKSKSQIDLKVNKIVDEFKINDLCNKYAYTLSSGEAQKVNLARAIIFEPKLLLLDEPTSNLDCCTSKFVEEKILEYKRQRNVTIILVTHNKELAKKISDERYYLNGGGLIEENEFFRHSNSGGSQESH